MTILLPKPGAIADRAAALYEAAGLGIDARSPNTVAAITTRIVEMMATDLYILQQQRARDQFLLTCSPSMLPTYGTEYGVPRGQPVAAAGTVLFAGVGNLAVPSGLQMTSAGGGLYVGTAAVAADASGAIVLPVAASIPGSAGDLPAGAVLTLVNPLAGLSPQSGTVGPNGLTGGADLEDPETWRGRILARKRRPGTGGTASDYVQWTQAALPGAVVRPLGNWPNLGAVTVVIAMPTPAGPRVPTAAELATALAFLTDPVRKPLTAQVNVLAAQLLPVAVTLHLIPDTVAIRASAAAALAAYFAADGAAEFADPTTIGPVGTPGAVIDVSRLDNAVSSASGEFAHDRIAPVADVLCTQTQLPVLGPVTFA